MLDANDPEFYKDMKAFLEDGSLLCQTLDRNRPYDGQPHTDAGVRGQQQVHGLTMRDITDCFIRGAFDSSGISPEGWPSDIHELPWHEMSPMAVCQNMMCWVEKYMGIFPNIEHPECKEWMDDFQQSLEDAGHD